MSHPPVICLLSFLFLSLGCYSQEHQPPESEHTPEGAWEVVLSGLSFFELGEEADSEERPVGSELHITYWFNHHWALGAGYTLKFEHEGERARELALIGSYKPVKWITFNAGPNVSLPKEDESLSLSAYVESEINIFIGNHFHFGPVIGGLLGEHAEIFAGVHLGYEF